MDFKIPGYTIIRKIGYGGSATVYLAVQENLNRRVALKVLHNSLTSDPNFDQRFLREGRIIAQLNHTNIVPVYDIGKYQHTYYMALEYLPGGDLKERAQAMTLAQLLQHMVCICQALQYAHDKGYVHRDIKPENILFRDDEAVLTDFGIARPTESLTNMTVDGAMLGTPAYMSPEQFEGKPLDGRTDLYSIGILLFEMLSGHLPLRGDSMISIGLKHVTSAVPLLPPETALFQSLIDTLLAKAPEQRPTDAAQVIEQLTALQRNKSFPANTPLNALWSDIPPEAAPAATKKFSVRIIASTSLVLVLLLGLVFFSVKAGFQNQTDIVTTPPLTPPPTDTHSRLTVFAKQLQRAQDLMDKEQLIAPEDNNALSVYRDVLSQAPDNATALSGVTIIQRRIVEQIEDAISSRALDQAAADLLTATQLWPDSNSISKLQQTLDSAIEADRQLKIQMDIAAYLRLANTAIANQQWTQPEQASALWYYQQSLKLDPDNQLAKAGVDSVAEHILTLARRKLDDNKFQAAAQLIDEAIGINRHYVGIRVIQEQLQTAKANYEEKLQQQKLQAIALENERALNLKIAKLDQDVETWIEGEQDYSQATSEANIINHKLQALLNDSPNNRQLQKLAAQIERHLETLSLKQSQTKQEKQDTLDANRFRFGNF